MKFVDQVRIFVASGAGGKGCLSFRREKYVPRGGPDGGDGGNGGSVVLKADLSKGTLIDLSYAPHIRAKHGQHGGGANCHGRNAQDRIVHVPPGTLIKDPESGEVLADLDRPGATFVAAQGGRGGRGNARFLSNANRAPRRADPGEPGQERWLQLELKLIADIGLVGLPNAGKSTLLSKLTRRKPKVADYPFTTLAPLLGVHNVAGRELVLADLPGLIEGASQGAGLGLRFLRHVERTRALIQVIDAADPLLTPLQALDVVATELAAYSSELAAKPRMVALNKLDLLPDPADARPIIDELTARGIKTVAISADRSQGLIELIDAALELLNPLPTGQARDPEIAN